MVSPIIGCRRRSELVNIGFVAKRARMSFVMMASHVVLLVFLLSSVSGSYAHDKTNEIMSSTPTSKAAGGFKSANEQPRTTVAIHLFHSAASAGRLPSWLSGRLYRNVPSMYKIGNDAMRHWFDPFAQTYAVDIEEDGIHASGTPN